MIGSHRSCLAVAVLLAATPGLSATQAEPALCADSYEKVRVRDYYARQPAQPPPVPSRDLELIESKIVSGLPPSEAIGTPATPQRLAEVWRSIEGWGASNTVGMVVTVDGWHAFNFPTRIPVTREKHAPGFYDVLSEGDIGVSGHIDPDLVGMIYAVRLPSSAGPPLRAVGLYSRAGDLILGVYGTEPGKPESAEVVAGFEKTWQLLESLPRACRKG